MNHNTLKSGQEKGQGSVAPLPRPEGVSGGKQHQSKGKRPWPQPQNGPSPLDEAKARVTIPDAWQRLALPGSPAVSCHSPFRPDRAASFSVFDNGKKWHDFTTGEGGDVVDFVAVALNFSKADAARWVIGEAGTKTAPGGPPRRPRPAWPVAASAGKGDSPDRGPVRFPEDMRTPVMEEMEALARLRGLQRLAVEEAATRGLLFVGTMQDGPEKVKVWILTDATKRNAQARRLDGKPWQSIGAKAKTLPGSAACWPVGLSDLANPERTAVLLVEGGPDLIAAFDLLLCAGLPVEKITVFCMFGAAQNIAPDAVDLLAKQPLWILPQGDAAGGNAVDRWAIPILALGRSVHVIRTASFGYELPDDRPVKDLNDLCLAPDLDGNPWVLRTCLTLCKHFNLNTFQK